jgi:hypothetical protein
MAERICTCGHEMDAHDDSGCAMKTGSNDLSECPCREWTAESYEEFFNRQDQPAEEKPPVSKEELNLMAVDDEGIDWSLPVKYASDCGMCPDCEEPWCGDCQTHYSECKHPGPASERAC